MLEALYDYAKSEGLVAKPGFKPKNIKFYINFSADGVFRGFDIVEDGAKMPICPDIGSLANGKTKSNIIAEKAEVIFNLPEKQKDGTLYYKRAPKQQFYLDALCQASQHDPLFVPAVKGLTEHLDAIQAAFAQLAKTKPSDFVSIKVEGQPLESSTGYLTWWETFRKTLDSPKTQGAMRCFITGDLEEPVKTVPPVQGLASVGGHKKGDSFICFDKDAYRSYGLEKAANAAVSEEAVAGMNAALTQLMKNAPPPLAGAKYIHWFSQQTANDVIEVLDYGFGGDDIAEEDTAEDVNRSDENRVRAMFNFMMNRTLPPMPENRYYMMALSGVNGRVMIRSYDEGTYDDLCTNIRAWYEDLAIEEAGYGKRYPKLFGAYSRLLKHTGDNKKLSDRIKKELSGIAPRILYAIMHNTVLPDSTAVKALAYIHSDMYSSPEDNSNQKQSAPDRVACQLLKAWLNRKYRNQKKEEFIIMEKLNPESPSVAYQTGRLMAAYAALQSAALGNVGAGIVERYYTSACTAPALVMGKLATMAQYHLSKLRGDKPGLHHIYSQMLEEITCKIGTVLPKTFTLEQQSEVALGYYFQNSQIRADIRARKEQSKKTEE